MPFELSTEVSNMADSSHMVESGVFEKVKKLKLRKKFWKTPKSRKEGKAVPKSRFRKVGRPKRTKW